MKTFFRLLALYLVVLLACVHKPFVKPAVQQTATCDTTAVTYSGNIQPVLQNNCYQCHGATVTKNGGLDLETFSSLKNYLQLGFRGDGLYGSKFYHCILHSENALPMPPTYVLDSCALAQIKRWIDVGALAN